MRRLIIAACLVAGVAQAQDAVLDAGGFRYFVWTNTVSTNWTPPFDAEAEVLVVGGGGGGGRGGTSSGGGGGAGGLVLTNVSLSDAEMYSITVGAGGAGVSGTTSGTDGSNSEFDLLVAIGGGGGGGGSGSGSDGGSGGGSWTCTACSPASTGLGGSGLQGNDGGGSSDSTSSGFGAGGGGGAGEKGGDGQSNEVAGSGGQGLDFSTWLSGLSLGDNGWFAGGGGGGTQGSSTVGDGGQGGGGSGGNGSVGSVAGMANTGGGGGGKGGGGSSSAGGSGIVIVRFDLERATYLSFETRQAFTTFSWNPPLEGTPTNYVIRIGTDPEALPVVAKTTDTSLLVDLRTLFDDFAPEAYWRVDVQTESDTIEGAVVQFRYTLSVIGDPAAEPVTARADSRVIAKLLEAAQGIEDVYYAGGYTYHVFTEVGSHSWESWYTGEAEVLVVGGGASGGGAFSGFRVGGGGGAGGLIYTNVNLVSTEIYSVSVGSGGEGVSAGGDRGNNGENSSFEGLVALGGGAGGSSSSGVTRNALNGGSGGGGGVGVGDIGFAGDGEPGQGHDGADAIESPRRSGGGGGAGSAAVNNFPGEGLDFGEWLNGLGFGRNGMFAEGGPGRNMDEPDTPDLFVGLPNTGSGGGGQRSNEPATSGDGGSGIVILRIPN